MMISGLNLSGASCTSSFFNDQGVRHFQNRNEAIEPIAEAGLVGIECKELLLSPDIDSSRDDAAMTLFTKFTRHRTVICKLLQVNQSTPVGVSVPYRLSPLMRYVLCRQKRGQSFNDWKWFPVDAPVAAVLSLLEKGVVSGSGIVNIVYGPANAPEAILIRFEIRTTEINCAILQVEETGHSCQFRKFAPDADNERKRVLWIQYGSHLSKFVESLRVSDVNSTVLVRDEHELSQGAALACELREHRLIEIQGFRIESLNVSHRVHYPVGLCGHGQGGKLFWRKIFDLGEYWSTDTGKKTIDIGPLSELELDGATLSNYAWFAEYTGNNSPPPKWITLSQDDNSVQSELKTLDIVELKRSGGARSEGGFMLNMELRTEFSTFGGGLRQILANIG